MLLAIATTLFAQAPETTAKKMKAIVMHQYGGPEVLRYEEAPRPEPNDDQVLIKIMAASVNPVDVAIRSGKYAEYFHTTLPLIPGMDAAGVVEKVGSKIKRLKPGDPVYAFFTLRGEGGYAEYAVARENEVAPKPATIKRLKATRSGSKLSVSWATAANAKRYELRATLTDGRKLFVRQKGTRFSIPSFAAKSRATITVTGLKADGTRGKTATVKVTAKKAKAKAKEKK